VLLLGNAARDEDAEMADALVNGIDDRLLIGPDVIHVGVAFEDPTQRLLRRSDVVAFGAEHHDRRTDVAQVNLLPVGQGDIAGGQVVANEEFVDNELNLLRVEIDVPTPPALEFKVAIGFGIDLRIDIVLLGPERVRGVLAFEILDQPGTIELPTAEIANERS
jgi:hypothetical protein